MSKLLMLTALILGFTLTGCAEGAGDKTIQQYAWRVEIVSTDLLCRDFRHAAKKGNRPVQVAILNELQKRQAAQRTLTVDSLGSAPPLGTLDTQVQCLWGEPDSKTRQISANGEVEYVYVYDEVERRNESAFSLYEETLVFRSGRLFSVAHVSL